MSSIKEFEVLSVLGSGSFASVHKVKRISDGQLYAMKKVKLPSLNPKEKENALNEVRILASINDRNIVGYKQAFYDEASQTLCIIMEFASGGDLLNKIQDVKKKGSMIPEETIWSYMIQMIQGLRTLHNMKILHRDLKCANIFLGADGKTIKLGDLNVSKITPKGLAHTQAGTPYYASPEIYQDKPYGAKSDMWSIGCVLYELCALLPPFRANDMSGLSRKVTKGVYDRIPAQYSSDLAKIIGMCLSVQPMNRPTCEKLLSQPELMQRMTEVDAQNQVKSLPVSQDLINTIKMPRNVRDLKNILPKSNYHTRDHASLNDLECAVITEEDIRKPSRFKPLPNYVRPSSGKPNISVDYRSPQPPKSKRDVLDSSLEGLIIPKQQVDKYQRQLDRLVSVPPSKPVEKVTSIQRAAKGVLVMDNGMKYVDALDEQLKGNRYNGMPRRSSTPNMNNKVHQYQVDPRENERLARKEYNMVNHNVNHNVNHRRVVRPLY